MATAERRLGERIRQALSEAKLSQAGLAGRMGVTRGQINHWISERQRPSDEQLSKIADVLKVEAGWLAGSAIPPEVADVGPGVQLVGKGGRTSAAYHWRPEADDGGRDFGNSNAYATPTDVQTFVRESGQNSKDQPADPDSPRIHIRYRVIELTRGSAEFDSFVRAAELDSLKEHLVASSEERAKLSSRLRQGLRRLDEDESLILVRVDDYGTTGLFGPEKGGNGSFAALIRDNLNSSKIMSSASGSYGVGKAVLWRSSDISTVFVASQTSEGREGHDPEGRVRLIGKSELTWHQCAEQKFAGPGWFGLEGTSGDSLLLPPGDPLLADLQLDRRDLPQGVDRDRDSGTSILIVGFRDLEGDAVTDPKRLSEVLQKQAAINFWPLILQEKLEMSVERFVDGRRLGILPVDPNEFVPEYCDAYRRHLEDEVVDKAIDSGDVVRMTFETAIPGTRDGVAGGMTPHEDLVAESQLVVRLAEPPEDKDAGEFVEKIALIRGGGLVTKYWSLRGSVVGGRPFHGLLLTGEGASMSRSGSLAEQFFGAAEPPAHDNWLLTDEIRDNYKTGAGTRINEMFAETTKLLREVIEPTEAENQSGPRELMRLLRIGKVKPKEEAATLRKTESKLVDGCWTIETRIHVNDRGKDWSITPRLVVERESRGPMRLAWKELKVLQGKVSSPDGSAFVVPAGTGSFRIRGVSEAAVDGIEVAKCRARLDLEIREK